MHQTGRRASRRAGVRSTPVAAPAGAIALVGRLFSLEPSALEVGRDEFSGVAQSYG